jgi:hypothetical protein
LYNTSDISEAHFSRTAVRALGVLPFYEVKRGENIPLVVPEVALSIGQHRRCLCGIQPLA